MWIRGDILILLILNVLEENERITIQKLYDRIGNMMYAISLNILRDTYDVFDILKVVHFFS